ncbi:uncharacterized protein [Palaemon carinicauda]|uniref:uncharacterized protein n=1 Tax=Palaemon carinicauda TaxID=392227 RepID=UPI0035B5ECA4
MDHFLCGLDSTQNAWYNPRPVPSTHEFAIGNSSFQLIPITTSSITAGIHNVTDATEFCNSNSGSDSSSTNPNSAFKPLHEVKVKSEEDGGTEQGRRENESLVPSIALTPLSTNKAHQGHKSKSGERWDAKKICNICGKILSRGDKLKNHIRTHTNNFPYHCDACGQGFLRSEGLRVHTRIHTGERPYVCMLCGKAYTRKDKLTRHAIIHTGERPFVCQHCGKSFTRKDKMQRHELIHRVDKPFSCSPCNLDFVRQETLNTHLEKKHPERLPYTLLHQARLATPGYHQEIDFSCLIDSKSGILKIANESGRATGSETPPSKAAASNTSNDSDPSRNSNSEVNPSSSVDGGNVPLYSDLTDPNATTTVDTSAISSGPLLTNHPVMNGFSSSSPFTNASVSSGGRVESRPAQS